MLHRRSVPSPRSILTVLLGLALAGALACSGGGGGGDPGPDEGSVGILLTDGPVDPGSFEHIYLTYTRITLIGGPKGNVVVFQGRKTIDLRDYEDVGKLVSLGRRVPAGSYEKARLDVAKIELVPVGGGASIFPKLPPKVDFNPQGDFTVRKGQLLLLHVDVVMGESLHIVETGNGGYRFRPVVFADIVSVPFPGKLVLLEGTVQRLDLGSGRFLLCDPELSVSRPREGGTRESDDDWDPEDPDDQEDHCVRVDVLPDTSFFDADGEPSSFDDLEVGDEVSVLGRFRRLDGEALVFGAEVVQHGSPLALDGIALGPVDLDDRFEMELDPGQGFASGFELLVELQDGAKVFRRSGAELLPEDIQPDDHLRAVGVLHDVPEELLKASVVIVDVKRRDGERIVGEIVEALDGGRHLTLDTETGDACVDVPDDAEVFRVEVGDGGAEAVRIDRADLMPGDEVNVFGTPDGCLEARTVIVFVDAMGDA